MLLSKVSSVPAVSVAESTPAIAALPYTIPAAPCREPLSPSKVALRASSCRFKKRGAAVTARIPRVKLPPA